MVRRPTVGIGGDHLHYNQLSQADLDELANKAPILTYGPPKQAPPAEFVPAHVAFDKKVSSGILGSPLTSDVEDLTACRNVISKPRNSLSTQRENCSDASTLSHRPWNWVLEEAFSRQEAD